jgi:hypothetical protein
MAYIAILLSYIVFAVAKVMNGKQKFYDFADSEYPVR